MKQSDITFHLLLTISQTIHRVSPKSFVLLNQNNSENIWPRNLVYEFFGKLKHVVNELDKNSLILSSHIKTWGGGATIHKTQNQVQIFCMINVLKTLK